ncbi:hypothetical protein GF318_01950 [Candidatus Micrarchaeota archaeon]|nr:hypothetical protein [Candidatus Micrarchaeota archaeon]
MTFVFYTIFYALLFLIPSLTLIAAFLLFTPKCRKNLFTGNKKIITLLLVLVVAALQLFSYWFHLYDGYPLLFGFLPDDALIYVFCENDCGNFYQPAKQFVFEWGTFDILSVKSGSDIEQIFNGYPTLLLLRNGINNAYTGGGCEIHEGFIESSNESYKAPPINSTLDFSIAKIKLYNLENGSRIGFTSYAVNSGHLPLFLHDFLKSRNIDTGKIVFSSSYKNCENELG